jgi:hypothetical protein
LFPFTDMSGQGKSEETPLWVTSEWPFVPSNENDDCETVKVFNCFACYKQSDWSKKITTVFIISLYIHDIRSLSCDLWWGFLRSPMPWQISKGEQVRDSNAMCLYQWIWLANILLKICILHVVTKEELPYWSKILHVIITTIKSKELKSIHSKHIFGQIYSHLKWTGSQKKPVKCWHLKQEVFEWRHIVYVPK